MPDITGQLVADAMRKDEVFSKYSTALQEVAIPFVVSMPEILKDQLKDPVTFYNVMKAKIAFMQYCIDNDYVSKAVPVVPGDPLGLISNDLVTSLMQELMIKAVNLIKLVASDVPGYLDYKEMDESSLMAHPDWIGLRPDVFDLYKAGRLTIGDLLVKQPMVIFNNTQAW